MKTVERGAELLDKVQPGWEDKIDLDELDLSSCSACILGQLYMDAHPRTRNPVEAYDRKRAELGIDPWAASRYGFTTWGIGTYENLTAAWRRLIQQRKQR